MAVKDQVARKKALSAYEAGDFKTALALQKKIVRTAEPDSADFIQQTKLFSLFHHTSGDTPRAVEIMESLLPLAPDDIEVRENLGVMLLNIKRVPEAVTYLRDVHEQAPDRFNICDALAHCYKKLNDLENQLHFGKLSLEAKDREAEARVPLVELPSESPKPFSFATPSRNIISFSLWGKNPRYLIGAIRNAMLIPDLYPGWTARFYCDNTVPRPVRQRLLLLGAQLVLKPRAESFFQGLNWRFEVASDPNVDRFLVRDGDSVVNTQERAAVDEWVRSDKHFHVMRDYATHTEVILAGMWGGVGGVLPTIDELLAAFKPVTAATRTYDQQLLRECVWPIVRQSVLIHDSIYTGCLGSVDFPELGRLDPLRNHVGQNEAAVSKGRYDFLLGTQLELCSEAVFLTPPACQQEQVLDLLKGFFESIPSTTLRMEDDFTAEDLSSIGRAQLATRRMLSESRLEDGSQGVSHVFFTHDTLTGSPERISAGMGDSSRIVIVADPRWSFSIDTKGMTATAYAESWLKELQDFHKFAQAVPGRVELFRLEDILGTAQHKLLKRIFDFLGLPMTESEIEDFARELPDPASKWSLSAKDFTAITETALEWVEKLQYPTNAGG